MIAKQIALGLSVPFLNRNVQFDPHGGAPRRS